MKISQKIYQLLEEKHDQFNRKSFIETDPIAIPHQFTLKEDIEIAAFITATIAWGLRKTIVKNANNFVQLMDFQPYDFIINHQPTDLKRFNNFKHRTFNDIDAIYFISSLKNIYQNHKGLENAFSNSQKSIANKIASFRTLFFELDYPVRTQKHVSNPLKNSAAKRINMFLRWMVRKDNRGVDFGIWKTINAQDLMCPLDVHSGNVARKLGLLQRKQNDWKAVKELTQNLRKMDENDPIKYDFSLFGLGVFDGF